MKDKLKLIAVGILLLLTGCIGDLCKCEYVVYESNPTNNYRWEVTYVSSWDQSCRDETLNEDIWKDSNNELWYSRTKIECD